MGPRPCLLSRRLTNGESALPSTVVPVPGVPETSAQRP